MPIWSCQKEYKRLINVIIISSAIILGSMRVSAASRSLGRSYSTWLTSN